MTLDITTVTPTPTPVPLTDTDYVLTEGAGWFEVKGFAIRIHATDEGVVVDVFDSSLMNSGEIDDSLVTSTYAFDHELGTPEETPEETK